MNKRSQIALAFAAGYVLLKTGIAIYRHPVGCVFRWIVNAESGRS